MPAVGWTGGKPPTCAVAPTPGDYGVCEPNLHAVTATVPQLHQGEPKRGVTGLQPKPRQVLRGVTKVPIPSGHHALGCVVKVVHQILQPAASRRNRREQGGTK